jgi:hypothetical protein
MEHSEAVELMATERYLLGELTAEQREAFEAHFFECYECALDVRAEAALIDEAKVQLPLMETQAPVPARVQPAPKRREWFGWMRPVWVVPAFAVMLAMIGYQNLATIPGLRSAATMPRIAPWASMHVGTRAGAHTPVTADRNSGALVLVDDLPTDGTYASFAFALESPQGKTFWTQTVKAPGNGDGTTSLSIPGKGLQEGVYTLTILGITPQGSRTQLDRRILDVRFDQ